MMERIAERIHLLGAFCEKRDLPCLTPKALHKARQVRQADVMVLFGGSILCGGDVLARAMRQRVAKRYLIVGGAGHTTAALRGRMRKAFSNIRTEGLPEAEIFAAYLWRRYGLEPDFLECTPTNCGNNITNLLALTTKTQYRV